MAPNLANRPKPKIKLIKSKRFSDRGSTLSYWDTSKQAGDQTERGMNYEIGDLQEPVLTNSEGAGKSQKSGARVFLGKHTTNDRTAL
jgi:hypothetical protein